MKLHFSMVLLKAYHAQRCRIRPYMDSVGLSPGQPKILSTLMRWDGCRQKDLADYCDIEPATVSKLLTNMEKAGLIRRDAAEGDRRAVCVAITEQGKEAHKRVQGHIKEVEKMELDGFTKEEQEKFREYLSRMYKNLTGAEIE